MILRCQRNKRKFNLESDRESYVGLLLSYDSSFDVHLKLKDVDYFESEDASDISNEILRLLKSNNVYEYVDEDGILYPYVSTTKTNYHNNQLMSPICATSINFLSMFADFLSSKERIDIIDK